MSIIPEHSLDLLQSTALAYMATIGPKGEPQVSAVWFTWDGTHLLFALNKKRQKYLNRDATSEETGPAEERVVIIVGPERVIPFPS
jgi:hypothetical protein